ncbi:MULTISPECIES: ParB/RepB/Spo0J family partition protein [Bacillaceae]|jgi:ParB family transcriptional regulator, chromosome partitioning protein|uniref:ParB/RepB/Spo0J family partition protein n=1 Tax=Cytobacillus firmus TaxID=1399 RepID=A0AA46NZY9_CYTFI|nr:MULTISPECIES: ParB/RepB/Spo0J family partition protein [Bacillaceae]KML40591.1 plasmid partitioning protein ParB [Cytobacillus firmus]MBG9446253.1 plasmid partitioning protein ParB [Cytobacillus firmus]MCC3648118.1 ParB/RepB/Spo0J family partition protein [Cytobacillus oceanisediminis]MCU1807469.1 ParB/RepB/Spo0J family partition protein [Cytobacillus firmus]UYG93476.1 ParB/RepB/Spo0J family partition protein [Cytobacillus firmus]
MAKGLGKGLNAFFNNAETESEETVQEVKIKDIRPNPYQPRKVFEKEAIEELKQSILEHGILQPIIVRKSIKGFEIVVGERRYRAAKEANLEKVPVVVRELTEQQMMELAVLENLQREDLTPIEEAAAYQLLMEKLKVTQEELAKRLGKSRPHIANHVRLLSLPPKIQGLISDGKISMGHGRALLGLRKKEKLQALVEKTVKDGLNVRQLEQLIQQLNDVSRETKKPAVQKDIFIKERESSLRERFGTTVHIKQSKNKGKIEIEFFSKEDLERIMELLETHQ